MRPASWLLVSKSERRALGNSVALSCVQPGDHSFHFRRYTGNAIRVEPYFGGEFEIAADPAGLCFANPDSGCIGFGCAELDMVTLIVLAAVFFRVVIMPMSSFAMFVVVFVIIFDSGRALCGFTSSRGVSAACTDIDQRRREQRR